MGARVFPGRLLYASPMSSSLPFSEACERNRKPILEALDQVFPTRGQVLEIGSCSGQHVVFFAPHFPELVWQPSDQLEYLEGLAARIRLEGGPNILDAVELDVLKDMARAALRGRLFRQYGAHHELGSCLRDVCGRRQESPARRCVLPLWALQRGRTVYLGEQRGI